MIDTKRDYVIIGGGCFGSFYVRQLLKWADRRGGPVGRLLVVDRDKACQVARELRDDRIQLLQRDWTAFLADNLSRWLERYRAGEVLGDRLVPSPLAPHIFLDSFARLTGSRVAPPETAKATLTALNAPFRLELDSGSLALSYATWICPVNCIEPATCPETRGPLDWSMQRNVESIETEGIGAHVLVCQHEAFGVGTIRLHDIATQLARLEDRVRATETAATAVVATVSTCHGVAGVLEFGG